MIKSEKINIAKQFIPEFPKLMIDKRDSEVILFIDNKSGIVLKSINRVIGLPDDNLIISDYENFNGKITLQNEV